MVHLIDTGHAVQQQVEIICAMMRQKMMQNNNT